ncbi:MAG: hypothetical protein M1837_005587 [Sclerophora amabilis]|nr:MAG: hypothetical protein M1837_005587 [Sclerophora amabilis]
MEDLVNRENDGDDVHDDVDGCTKVHNEIQDQKSEKLSLKQFDLAVASKSTHHDEIDMGINYLHQGIRTICFKMQQSPLGAFGAQHLPADLDAYQVPPDDSNQTSTESPVSGTFALRAHDRTKKRVLASCDLCRRRKIKCDRAHPCANCVRTGASCVPNAASNAPRGRNGGRKKNESRLLQRIARLEHLVEDIGSGTVQTPTHLSADQDKAQVSRSNQHPKVQSEVSTGGAAKEGVNGDMGTSLWATLSDEINGLRDVLSQSSEDEDEDRKQSSNSNSQSPVVPNHSSFVIRRPDLYNMDASTLSPPTPPQVGTFCSVYLSNVDPVLKLLHGPSLRRYLHGETRELACSPGTMGLHALRYAVFYAATTSLTPDECERQIGEERAALLTRYRAEIELGLAMADFVHTEELSTLQALVIFLFSVRANDSTRFSWTLTSLAVRIAHALGLHREGRFPPHSPFLLQMRRRLWWQICELDSHAASDRGSDPFIAKSSFNTKLPLHVDDEDLCPEDLHEVSEREGFVQMTFSLICHEVFDVIRQLNYVPAGESRRTLEEADDPWAKRRNRVIACQRRIEQRYLRQCKGNGPFQQYTRLAADIITAVMWLMTYRPLQRQTDITASIPVPYPGILHLSVEVIEKTHQIYADPVGRPFKWQSSTWVMWHAMAVMLAELCIQTEGTTVERAWAVVDSVFEEMAQHVADSEKGRLWRPIRKLMNRASKVRKRRLGETTAPADLDAMQRPLSTNQAPPNSSQTEPLVFDASDPKQGASDDLVGMSGGWGQDPLTTNALPIDWDPWLNANVSDMTHYNDEINQMAWANWTDFISDFQGEGGPSPGQDALM